MLENIIHFYLQNFLLEMLFAIFRTFQMLRQFSFLRTPFDDGLVDQLF